MTSIVVKPPQQVSWSAVAAIGTSSEGKTSMPKSDVTFKKNPATSTSANSKPSFSVSSSSFSSNCNTNQTNNNDKRRNDNNSTLIDNASGESGPKHNSNNSNNMSSSSDNKKRQQQKDNHNFSYHQNNPPSSQAAPVVVTVGRKNPWKINVISNDSSIATAGTATTTGADGTLPTPAESKDMKVSIIRQQQQQQQLTNPCIATIVKSIKDGSHTVKSSFPSSPPTSPTTTTTTTATQHHNCSASKKTRSPRNNTNNSKCHTKKIVDAAKTQPKKDGSKDSQNQQPNNKDNASYHHSSSISSDTNSSITYSTSCSSSSSSSSSTNNNSSNTNKNEINTKATSSTPSSSNNKQKDKRNHNNNNNNNSNSNKNRNKNNSTTKENNIQQLTPQQLAKRKSKAVAQVEYFFSASELAKNAFLRRHMDCCGYLPFGIMYNFPSVLAFRVPYMDFLHAVNDTSEKLEIDLENECVRIKCPADSEGGEDAYKKWLFPNPDGTLGCARWIKDTSFVGVEEEEGSSTEQSNSELDIVHGSSAQSAKPTKMPDLAMTDSDTDNTDGDSQ